MFSKLQEKILTTSIKVYFNPVLLPCLMFTMAALFTVLGVSAVAEAQPIQFERVPDDWFMFGYCRIIALSVGSFGALVMVVAGIVAIMSAASGNYRTSMAVLMVATGAFILENLIDLFFNLDFECEISTGGGGGGGGNNNLFILDFEG